MRPWIKDEIISSFYYRNELGNPLYTITIGFLFANEILEIVNMGFRVNPINNGYNQISYPQNFIK